MEDLQIDGRINPKIYRRGGGSVVPITAYDATLVKKGKKKKKKKKSYGRSRNCKAAERGLALSLGGRGRGFRRQRREKTACNYTEDLKVFLLAVSVVKGGGGRQAANVLAGNNRITADDVPPRV